MSQTDSTLEKSIAMVMDVNKAFSRDTALALGKLGRVTKKAKRKRKGNVEEVSFWAKVMVFCLVSQVDATAHAMRRLVVLHAAMKKVELSDRDSAKLREKRIQKSTGKEVDRHLTPLESWKLACRHFPRAYGVAFTLDTTAKQYRAFLALIEARNESTHPKRIEHLYQLKVNQFLAPAWGWFGGELLRLLCECGRQIGLDLPEPSTTDRFKLEFSPPPELALFSEEEMASEIATDGGRTLAYTKHFLRLLTIDSRFASRLNRRFSKKKGKTAEFARRIALRMECSQLEASHAAITFLLQSARERGEISFEDSELSVPKGESHRTLRELVLAAEVWSREVGDGVIIDLGAEDWRRIEAAWKKRDQLTHPRDKGDLKFVELEGLWWSLALNKLNQQVTAAMMIDSDKWAEANERGKLLSKLEA